MTGKPLVSIALPCYNAERTVVDTARSIFFQTYADWELLALDDGSTDGTLDFLRSLRDSRVKVVADGVNKGRCYRLNQAALMAEGKYYARMDADDLMFPERLAKQIAFLEEHPEVDLVGAGIVSVDGEFSPLGVRLAPPRVESPLAIFKGEVLYHPTVVGRTEWFRRHPYIEGYVYSDDFALWTKAAADLRIANLPEPLVFYLEHGQFTYAKYRGRRRDTWRAIRFHGPPAIGWAATAALLLRRLAKDAVYAACHYCGCWDWVFNIINESVSEGEKRRYTDMIGEIRGVKLPGTTNLH